MIRFKMFRISTGQFAILSEKAPQGEVNISTNIEMKPAKDGSAVQVCAKFSFKECEKQIMLLDVACEFLLNPDDIKAITTDSKVVIPKDILDYFIAQTIGTARGILHCKTEGTAFNGIILPPMDISKLLKGDMVVDLSKH